MLLQVICDLDAFVKPIPVTFALISAPFNTRVAHAMLLLIYIISTKQFLSYGPEGKVWKTAGFLTKSAHMPCYYHKPLHSRNWQRHRNE